MRTCRRIDSTRDRRGAILVLAAVALIGMMAFVAFTVDVGYISLSKGELQKTADASALSSVIELPEGYGPGAIRSQSDTETAARSAAVDVASYNRAAGETSAYVDGAGDVRFGQYSYQSGAWVKTWNTGPYNMVEVTLRRNKDTDGNGQPNTGGDRPLNLSFAPVLGRKTSGVSAKAIAVMQPGGGFRVPPGGGPVNVLPIALDQQSWNALMAGTGPDNYSYDPATGAVSNGADGIKELDLYPSGSSQMPPGNRGTVDFGSSNNSTNDLKRQILYGLNEDDLSYFGGELRFDSVPLVVNGDPGLSAGIKAQLTAIIGQPRAIPIFSQVSGPGNNAMYTIVKFVGIRLLAVKLTGGNKYVRIQPAPFVGAEVIPADLPLTNDSIFTRPMLVK